MTLPDPVTDPAGYVLAVADLREQRTRAASSLVVQEIRGVLKADTFYETAEHIAAEANPEHALKEVALWRGIAERHGRGYGKYDWCETCGGPDGAIKVPCADLRAVVAAAKAYDQTKELG